MALNWLEDVVSHLYRLKGYLVVENEDLQMPQTESRRVRAAWAMSAGKSKVMSSPASALPKGSPLRLTSIGRLTLPPSQALPSSSGVTATGEPAEDGLDWKKPKPLASSPGMSCLRLTSFTSRIRRIASAATSRESSPAGCNLLQVICHKEMVELAAPCGAANLAVGLVLLVDV